VSILGLLVLQVMHFLAAACEVLLEGVMSMLCPLLSCQEADQRLACYPCAPLSTAPVHEASSPSLLNSAIMYVGLWYAGSHVDYAPSALYSTIRSAWGSKMQLPEAPLFNGLRVRMGVVTGDVPSGTALKNSALFQLAKGTGGQTSQSA
jgi:hypothetical protein